MIKTFDMNNVKWIVGKLTLFVILFTLGCTNWQKSADNEFEEKSEDTNLSATIEVSTVEKHKILKEYEGISSEVLTYKIVEKSGSDIYIEPTSNYYDNFVGDSEFEIPIVSYYDTDEATEYVSYPQIKLYITNNTNYNLNISKLEVLVNSSCIDKLPYVHLGTEEAYSNCLAIVNESWSNLGEAKLDYTILTKDETFDGVYEKSRKISFNKGIHRINFLKI